MAKISIMTLPCALCHEVSNIEVDEDGLRLWRTGMYIQDAFPELSAPERELIMTGTHPVCWDMLWKDAEEEE